MGNAYRPRPESGADAIARGLGSLADRLSKVERGVVASGGNPLPRFTSAASRDATFISPRQGDLCQRIDTGWLEQYYALWDASLNPQGTVVAGWFPISGKLPRARIYLINGCIGIAVNSYCCTSTYTQTPTQDSVWQIAYNGANGRFTPPVPGAYIASWHVGVSTGSGSLEFAVSLNSTTNPTTNPAGSPQGVNGEIAQMETPANASYYTWMDCKTPEITTTLPTDYIQIWFGAGAGSSAWPTLANTRSQWIEVAYSGPPQKLY